MLLRSGKTFDQAIELLDEISQGGLNDLDNSIPRIGSPSFDQLMPVVALQYQRWTATVATQLHEVFREGPIVGRLRADMYWLIMSSQPALPRTASMIHTELSELRSHFARTANELRQEKERYT